MDGTHQAHRLLRSEFDLLASARAAPGPVRALKRSRVSRTLLLLRYILDGSPELRPAARLLAEAHDTDPAAVNELLISPWVSLWAAVCARDLTQRRHRLAANAVALAAAARCGMGGRAMVLEPHDGRIMIPTVGMLARGGPGRVTAEDLAGPWWWPVRSLTAVHSGRRISVSLDDVDPYRGFHGAQVQSRLTAAQFDTVTASFRDAWRLLVERCPRRAAELAGGLMSITPLLGGDAGEIRSATSPEAFGGVATTMPPDGVEFAVVMVREFQHSKLSALAALAPLWRTRPVCALMHRVYALTAVAALWRDLKTSAPAAKPAAQDPHAHARAEGLRDLATREFAFVRAQLRRAVESLGPGDPGLTAAGRRLVARVDQTMKSLARVNVPPAIEAQAGERLAIAT